ncbi:hypothetical protein CI238_13034 [Colletotrichum incanum]|uniref:Uncharacterized protein n=1 Tax=Colletotrichum incanum TaxID=1573173 RepID=A0A166P9L3_COLIC|nr:hypothetical protein CI238_13034 [Colletotrichum incanum]
MRVLDSTVGACAPGLDTQLPDSVASVCQICAMSVISIAENGSLQRISITGRGTTIVRNMHAGHNSTQIVVNPNAGTLVVDDMQAGSGTFQIVGSCDDEYIQRSTESYFQQQQLSQYLGPEETREIAVRVLNAGRKENIGAVFGTLSLLRGREVLYLVSHASEEAPNRLTGTRGND